NVRTLGYNAHNQLTSDSWSPLLSTFGYDSTTGLLNSVTLGSSPNLPYTIVSAAATGLGTTVPGPAWASITDGNSHTTKDLLDARGRLLQEVLPLGETTTYQLDAAGNPVKIIDPMGYVTLNTFDGFNNLLTSKHPDGGLDTYSYN